MDNEQMLIWASRRWEELMEHSDATNRDALMIELAIVITGCNQTKVFDKFFTMVEEKLKEE